MQFIDTHIHLQDYKTKNTPQIITAALSAGVAQMVCASTSEADWQAVASLAGAYPGQVIPAFGLHPWHLDNTVSDWEVRLEGLLQKYSSALVGESGLDRLKNPDKEPQNSIFRIHIELAHCLKRGLIVHAVKAQDWLEEYWKILPERFVFHSYNGKAELLKKIIKAGGYVSFSHSVLRNPAREEILKAVPRERLLVETDGPYQGLEGKDSTPEQLPELLKRIAALRGEDYQELSVTVYQNSLRFIYGKN